MTAVSAVLDGRHAVIRPQGGAFPFGIILAEATKHHVVAVIVAERIGSTRRRSDERVLTLIRAERIGCLHAFDSRRTVQARAYVGGDHVRILPCLGNGRRHLTSRQQQRCSAHNSFHLSVPLGGHWWRSSSSVAERGGRQDSQESVAFARGCHPDRALLGRGVRAIPGASAFSSAPSTQPRDGEVLPVEDRQPGLSS
jgi:hypothetical protein